eukprot:gnl/Spiro4/15820_TR8515_c0_g1_i1.p1 gnl/Spiro4/15820_TR8515_c0_g1~~gnl/Spiro4/15820_TR8515_c0_g1_i1.p1  ORF type:complete len:470 (-),score=132.29 gnl/Spiro4/15820_TR8515_c0_g1_i1:102-1448(-)
MDSSISISDLYRQNGGLCKWSPDSQHLANVTQFRLLLRDSRTLQIVQLYTCLDVINQIEWSSDSKYVLCGLFKRGLVQVWSLENPDWTCKIDEGAAGVVHARWSPDGRHILTTADFNLRVTIWSLVNRSVSCIKFPKFSSKGLSFSNNGQYMALAERRECKDSVGIYACDTWQMVKNFGTDTQDLADLSWSPDDRYIAVWDTTLVYTLLVYTPDGHCVHRFRAYENALGIKSVAWSPSSRFLAIGSYDQKVRIINNQSWKVLGSEYLHRPTARVPPVVVFVEHQVEQAPHSAIDLASPALPPRSRYELGELPLAVRDVRPDPDKPNPKLGVGLSQWSPDNRFLMTKNDNMPHALWLWDTQRLALSVLIVQHMPIRAARWDPTRTRLALCTGNSKVYFWSEVGCSSVDIPPSASANFKVTNIEWNADGNSLLLMDKERFCVCYPDMPEH